MPASNIFLLGTNGTATEAQDFSGAVQFGIAVTLESTSAEDKCQFQTNGSGGSDGWKNIGKPCIGGEMNFIPQPFIWLRAVRTGGDIERTVYANPCMINVFFQP